jgi:hypothetical protein
MFYLQQNWRRGQNIFCLEARECWGQDREMAQTVYIHMNKCIKNFKNLKICSLFNTKSTTLFRNNRNFKVKDLPLMSNDGKGPKHSES